MSSVQRDGVAAERWRDPQSGYETSSQWVSMVVCRLFLGLAFLKRDFDRILVRDSNNYTIFEGISEIQRLIISRAVSGVHIR